MVKLEELLQARLPLRFQFPTRILLKVAFKEFLKELQYRISSVIRRSFFLPKQSQRSRSVLQDGSRSLKLFWKGIISIIAKFHRTDLVI